MLLRRSPLAFAVACSAALATGGCRGRYVTGPPDPAWVAERANTLALVSAISSRLPPRDWPAEGLVPHLAPASHLDDASFLRELEGTTACFQGDRAGRIAWLAPTSNGALMVEGEAQQAHLIDLAPGLPRAALARLPLIDRTEIAAVSSDGRWLATCATSGQGSLWRLAPGVGPRAIADLGYSVKALAFTPNCERLLVGRANGSVIEWSLGSDTDPARPARVLELTKTAFRSLTCAADDLLLAEAEDYWSPETLLLRVSPGEEPVRLASWPSRHAQLSPDGRWLVTTETIHSVIFSSQLWRVSVDGASATRRVIAMTAGWSEIAFSPASDFLAAADGKAHVSLWRLDPRGQEAPWPAARLWVETEKYGLGVGPLAFTAEGNVLLVVADHQLRAWPLFGRQQVHVGEDQIRWERTRAVPPGAPRLQIETERAPGSLTIRVSNRGDGVAEELAGTLAFESELAPLGTRTPVVFGTIPPGESVTRQVQLPGDGGLVLRALEWSDRWGHAPPKTVLEPEPDDLLTLRRSVLREAARLALDTEGEVPSYMQEALTRDHESPPTSTRWEAPRPKGWGRREHLAADARALAREGRIEEARRAIADLREIADGDHVDDEPLIVSVVLELACAEAQAGHPDAARRTARSITYRRWFDPLVPATWWSHHEFSTSFLDGLYEVTDAWVAGAALRLHMKLGLSDPDLYLRSFETFDPALIPALAGVQTRSGDPRGARAWAERLSDPSVRASALYAIGHALLVPETELDAWPDMHWRWR